MSEGDQSEVTRKVAVRTTHAKSQRVATRLEHERGSLNVYCGESSLRNTYEGSERCRNAGRAICNAVGVARRMQSAVRVARNAVKIFCANIAP